MRNVTKLRICAVLLASTVTPAMAAFEEPFTGTVDIQVLSMDFSGNTGLGFISTTFNSSAPGTLNVADGRIVDDGSFSVSYTLNTQLGGIVLNGRNFLMTAAGDSAGNATFFPNYPLDPSDPLPPTDGAGPGAGDTSGDSNFQTTGQIFDTGAGVVIDAEQIVLEDLVSRTPIPGGEVYVYEGFLALVGTFNSAPVILGLGDGTIEIQATPEPASLLLLLAGLPLLRRRSG